MAQIHYIKKDYNFIKINNIDGLNLKKNVE